MSSRYEEFLPSSQGGNSLLWTTDQNMGFFCTSGIGLLKNTKDES
ncbi:hypothetical protein [Pedobacter caeni]|uniref:Uncharacterized protein n=1 Tax=Pedobacter caeni TaxID=288992 RepID=A0A1M5D4P0_9SPHI|nr:hypothetical protein [Pedobacter caeni]SHF61805.1 hypothetical protein SAMN04488522_10368 [Pedobacter caeni]